MTEKIALITGASRGLGAALAEALWRDPSYYCRGMDCWRLRSLDDRIQKRGGQAVLADGYHRCQGHGASCHSIYERWGKIDLWAHSAIHAALEPRLNA